FGPARGLCRGWTRLLASAAGTVLISGDSSMSPLIHYGIPFLIALACGAATPGNDVPPTDKPVAYRGARILPVSGPPIERGVLVVREGKIVAVGPEDRIEVAPGATVHDLSGKTIIPGLVDTHSHIGIYPR